MSINKQSNIISLLDLVLFMGIAGYFLQAIKHIYNFILIYQEDAQNFCMVEGDCILIVFIGFFLIMFILQIYVAYLFKKRRKNFPIWFVLFFSFGFLSELAIYINESIMSSSTRLIFNGVFLIIFTLYLFYSEEGKKVFSE